MENSKNKKTRIKELREKFGLSQQDIGAMINSTRQYISQVEASKHDISDKSAKLIADGLGISTDEIFGTARISYSTSVYHALKNLYEHFFSNMELFVIYENDTKQQKHNKLLDTNLFLLIQDLLNILDIENIQKIADFISITLEYQRIKENMLLVSNTQRKAYLFTLEEIKKDIEQMKDLLK